VYLSLQTLADQNLPADGASEDLLDTVLDRPANGIPEDDVALLAACRRPR
jgi:hypothetical protein